jgi:signal transduction histidine kinase/CheY-like chemotaxis protein
LEPPAAMPARVAFACVDPTRPPDEPAASDVAKVIRTGKTAVLAARDKQGSRDGSRPSSVIIVPLAIGMGRIVGAISFALTESGRRYDAEDTAFVEEVGRRIANVVENANLYVAEQRAREAADAANRAKDEFLAAVSHELRTPLNAILGWARLLSAGLDDQKRSRAAETIERNASTMAQLIEDLLDISRIISGKMRLDITSVDLRRVVEAAVEAVKPAADAKQIRIEMNLDPGAGPIFGDATRLQQVVWNLLSNAVKFTPKGGHASVALRRVESLVEIVVTDSGKGIDPRFLPYAFDPFRQAEGGISRTSGGLGLGLAIARNLVELHGGRIEASSPGEGRGARFAVRIPLPAVRPSEPPDPPVDSRPFDASPQLRGLSVLVVDDEPDARVLLQTVLERCGCNVTTASDVSAAMTLIEANPPDVLLSDIGMPGENGYDLIRRVRALAPDRGGDVAAAALTAYARAEDRRRALAAGYMMHVPKPVELAELVAIVTALARFGRRGR